VTERDRDEKEPAVNIQSRERWHAMSAIDFANYGLQEIAYVKPVAVDGRTAFAVHGADGTPLTVMVSREAAFAVCKQNDLEPFSAH
jgi:hypothetical protein